MGGLKPPIAVLTLFLRYFFRTSSPLHTQPTTSLNLWKQWNTKPTKKTNKRGNPPFLFFFRPQKNKIWRLKMYPPSAWRYKHVRKKTYLLTMPWKRPWPPQLPRKNLFGMQWKKRTFEPPQRGLMFRTLPAYREWKSRKTLCGTWKRRAFLRDE